MVEKWVIAPCLQCSGNPEQGGGYTLPGIGMGTVSFGLSERVSFIINVLHQVHCEALAFGIGYVLGRVDA